MSLDNHLIHTCTIENPATGSLNAYGNASKASAAPQTNVKCRLIEDRELVPGDDVSEGYIQTVYKLMVHGSVDLREKAKISSITLEDGTVMSDLFAVQDVLHRRGRNLHHKTATLERIS